MKPPDWIKQLERDARKFITQTNRKMVICVIPASCWDSMIAAGNCGDMDARCTAYSISEWSGAAARALKNGTGPGCVCCDKKLDFGMVGGWAVMRPAEGEGIGLVSAYCKSCIKRDRNELIKPFTDQVAETFGIACMPMQ
jgi:hypothetical protein